MNKYEFVGKTREEAIEMASAVLDYEDDERGYLDTFRYLANKNPSIIVSPTTYVSNGKRGAQFK